MDKGRVSRRHSVLLALTSCATLSACATASRGSAATLADAGVASTSAFARDYRTTASRLRDIEASDAFTNTLAICSNPNLQCAPEISPDANHAAREDLARTIELRGRAVDALSSAYSALKAEAAYDAKADIVSATNSAVDAVNSFTSSVLALGGAQSAPAAALISEPLKRIVGFAAGGLADRAQTRRLKNASHVISDATLRLRDALSVEAFVFDGLASHIVEARLSAKQSLLSAGMASNQSIITPLIENLQLKPADGLEGTIRKSNANQEAVKAVLAVQSQAEVEQIRARYAASIKALTELLKAHAEFERDEPLSLAELDRFLSGLNVATNPSK